MSKRYTAQQMREAADYFAVGGGHDLLDGKTTLLLLEKEDIAAMLRQAADDMEREMKYQYQYAARYFYPSGVIATDHIFDNPSDAKIFSSSRDGAKKIICRRTIGEWEEARDA